MLDLKELDSVKMSQLGELLQESFAGLCNVVPGSHCDDQIPKKDCYICEKQMSCPYQCYLQLSYLSCL